MQTCGCADNNRKGRDKGRKRHFGFDTKAQPRDEQGRKGNLGHRVQCDEIGHDCPLTKGRFAHQYSQGEPKEHGKGKAVDNLFAGDPQRVKHVIAGQKVLADKDHVAKRLAGGGQHDA